MILWSEDCSLQRRVVGFRWQTSTLDRLGQSSLWGCDYLVLWPLVGPWCKLGFCSCAVLLQKKPVRESTQRTDELQLLGKPVALQPSSKCPRNSPAGESGSTSPLRRPKVSVCNETTCDLITVQSEIFFLLRYILCIQSPIWKPSPPPPSSGSNNLPISTLDNTYLCLAVLDGVLCVIFLHGRSSPQTSPSSTPLPDEEPQLRGPARGAGRAAALPHALRSLWPGHRSPERKAHRSRLALNIGQKVRVLYHVKRVYNWGYKEVGLHRKLHASLLA